MKPFRFFFLLMSCFLFSLLGIGSLAQNLSVTVKGDTPTTLLDAFVDKANDDGRIQNTSLNGITSLDAGHSGNPNMKITNTLMRITKNIHVYLQWIVFFAFSLATILIIYNGFLMVTNVVHNKGDLKKIKTNFVYLGIGVVILVGFYFLMDLVVALINFLA